MPDIFGRQSPTPFAYFDPESACLRTSQGTLALDLTECSLTLPRAGSMRNGQLFERPTLERRTDANAYLSTPLARDGKGTPKTGFNVGNLCSDIAELLPTPRATDGTKGGPNQRGSKGDRMLPSILHLLPTPTVGDSKSARNKTLIRRTPSQAHSGTTLTDLIGDITRPPFDDGKRF